jgi:hypothetical protein
MIYEASTGQLGSPSKGDPKLPPIPITAPGDRWLVASRDGVHWTEPQPFGGVGAFPPGTFGAAAGGMFATAFKTSNADLCAGPQQCTLFQTTTDAGATWSRHVVSLPSDASGAPLVAADPQAPGRFTIAVLTSGQAQFSVYQTQDAGNTWSGPTTITDDPTKTHFHPWMAYSPKGVVGLMWQTNVNSAPAPAGGGLPAALSESALEALPEPVREGVEAQTAGPPSPYNVWAATSGDGGATFSEPLKISKADSPAPQPFLPYGIGDDFSFIALSGTHAFVGWADYRPGDRQGFFSAVDLDAFARNGTSG